MKKSKILSLLTAGALCMTTMLPMSVFAAAPSSPYVASATIADSQSFSDANGNLYLTVPSNTQLAGKTFNLTTSEEVSFVATPENAAANGELYAYSGSSSSASLRFAIDLSEYVSGSDVNFNTPAYSIDLTSTDGTNWNGSFNTGFDTNMATLGQALNMTNATLRTGMMENSTGLGNDAWRIRANFDAVNTQLVIYDADSTMYTVTYNYEGGSYEWELPEGAPLPQVTIPGNLTLEGWYTDNTYITAVDFATETVTGDRTIFAKTSSASSGNYFLSDLEKDATVLRIGSAADFSDFVNNSTKVDPDQRVVLTTDIDLNNASYQAIQFEGDFDGQGNTISNVRFTANGSYAGMFSELGATQKIANLNLNNVTVTGGTFSGYAGVLAGQVYGVNETPRLNCLVQNVHVTNSSVTGYTSGGLVGFSFACTLRYCSVEDTSVTGLANGGGITGLTYADIIACYSTVSPFGLQARGRGGIAGKLLESGKIQDCWCSYSAVYGSIDNGTDSNNITTNNNSDDWETWTDDLSETVWTVSGQSAAFISETAIWYSFGN